MSTVSQPPSAGMLDVRVRVPQHVVYRSFAAETVMLNLQTGQYHGINPVGGRMIEALERCSSVRKAAEELGREFNVPTDQLERDLCEFCVELGTRGLVEFEQPAPECSTT